MDLVVIFIMISIRVGFNSVGYVCKRRLNGMVRSWKLVSRQLLAMVKVLGLMIPVILVSSVSQVANVNVHANMIPVVNIGDYIQFGKYNNAPILWRVIHKDANGDTILFSDRILTFKAFDSKGVYHKGPGGTDRVNYGSNYYPNSNIRQWLNSSSSNSGVKIIDWIQNNPDEKNVLGGYNPYFAEKGFLADGNFTTEERNAIMPLTHKVLLSNKDISNKDGGTFNYWLYDDLDNMDPDYYESAYHKHVTDRVLLLSVKQIQEWIYNNRSILGEEYYIAKPTPEAVLQSTYKNTIYVNHNLDWAYWLSSPASNSTYFMRPVGTKGNFDYYYPTNSVVGVRPALQLNLSTNIVAVGGSGTSSSPYIFTGTNILTSDIQAPTIPNSIVASNISANSMNLTWTASSDNVGVTAYDIYNGSMRITTVMDAGGVAAPPLKYYLTGLSDGKSHIFSIKAIDAAGNVSAASPPLSVDTLDSTPPTLPEKLILSNVTGTALTLNWAASTDNVGVIGYEVYRNGKLIGVTKLTNYRISGLNDNALHSFAVRASDASKNKSASSKIVSTQPTIKLIGKQVYANFKLLNLGTGLAPSTVKGQTVIPHKPVLESMGLTVKYDSKTKTVTANKKGFSIKMTEGKTVVVVNGKNKKMPVAPVIQKGTLMIPLNFVAKELGYQVMVTK
jgi:chitodextrinase